MFAPGKQFLLLMGVLAAAASYPASALDLPLRRITDDSALRTSVRDSWFVEAPFRVLQKKPAVFTLDGGGRVELRVEAAQDEFHIILARELMSGRVDDDPAGTNALARSGSGVFRGWAQGSWVLARRTDSGEPVRLRVFLRSDPYTFIQFRPDNNGKCLMDVPLYDAYLGRSLPLPVPFERLYTMPLEEILNLAGDKFPRRYFEPQPADYRSERQFIARVRERLPELRFSDDGAIDESGRYVYINTGAAQEGEAGLNCSGFAKWLIDGILRPVSGGRLSIPPLKAPYGERGSSFTEPWEAARDPYFGLDWIRNLAERAWSALRSPAFGVIEEFEVRADPFSQVIVRGKNTSAVRSYPGYLQDAGYGVEGLHPLLYMLAVDEPGKFYLAAVNTETGPAATPDNPRGRPRLRQYFHIAALVPYFNEYGVFRVAVFESAAETSFNDFKARYPGHQVNLVRIPIETRFEP